MWEVKCWKRLVTEVAEWCSEQSDQVEAVAAHGRGVGLNEL